MKSLLFSFLLFPIVGFTQILTTNMNQLNFGNVFENAPDSLPILIMNNSNQAVTATLKFYSVLNSNPFSSSAGTISIPAQGSQIVTVKFSPEHNIQHNSEMLIQHNAASGLTSVDLVGQGKYSNTYYNSTENLSEEALKTALKARLAQNYLQRSYNAARDFMFMTIDNQSVNGQGASTNTLECVYTGTVKTGYSSRSNAQSTNPNFNTEHTFPQGFFNSVLPERSDIHHLFPTTNVSNSTRSNKPFGVVTGGSAVGGGSFSNSSTFEPRDAQKGRTARAMMYFVIRYQDYSNHFASQENILKSWHNSFPPNAVEKTRNDDIFLIQRNRNPFVDYPQFVDRISNFVSTSTAPVIRAIDITQSSINFGQVSGTADYNYVLVNRGNQSLQLSNISLSNTTDLSFRNGFGATASIPAGESLIIPIQLQSSNLGSFSATLNFNTNIPGSQSSFTIPISANIITHISENELEQSIQVFPNPMQQQLSIQSEKVDIESIQLLDATGRLINVHAAMGNPRSIVLDTEHLATGVYTLMIQSGEQMIQKKLLK